jgi:hypothetical protein
MGPVLLPSFLWTVTDMPESVYELSYRKYPYVEKKSRDRRLIEIQAAKHFWKKRGRGIFKATKTILIGTAW